MPMPQCTYTIRKDELNGDVLKYARVGDQVVHVWECLSGQQFFFLNNILKIPLCFFLTVFVFITKNIIFFRYIWNASAFMLC